MKIYYIASPRGLKNNAEIYEKTYQVIKNLGHELVSDLVIKTNADTFYSASHKQRVEHYKKTMEAIKKCDLTIVEVSVHSMSMGYIVDKALEQGKPVIVLHLPGYEPYFFSGIQNDRLQIWEYTLDEIKKVITQAIEYSKDQMDVRFNFFVSPRIVNYLDWIAKQRKMPRAVYLRRLIEKDMDKNKDFEKEE